MYLKNYNLKNKTAIVTGAGMADLSGFTLTMAAQETLPAYFVDATAFEAEISTAQINP